MAWRSSFSRSFVSAARISTRRPTPTLPSFGPPRISARGLPSRRLSFSNPRMMGELGCAQSLMPLYGGALSLHLAVSPRGCCELYHGTLCRACQDR